MAYLTSQDFNSELYPEIQTAISRGDATVMEKASQKALSLIRSRLSRRYDIAGEYAQQGDARNSFLLTILIPIAVYQFYKTQEIMPQIRRMHYQDAMEELKLLQSGESVLDGVAPAPKPDDTTTNPGSTVAYSSNRLRDRFW